MGTPSPPSNKPKLNSKSTETGTCLRSIDLEMTSRLLMRLSPSSSKSSKVLMTSSETNNMMRLVSLMIQDSKMVCSETPTLMLEHTPVKPTGKVLLPPESDHCDSTYIFR